MSADATSIVLIGAGIIAVLIAARWRNATLTRRSAQIATALTAPDVDTRTDAARQLIASGLDRSAPLLLEYVFSEPIDAARAAVARAVLERQWEPSGSGPVDEIRVWAGTELERQGFGVVPFAPAFTRVSDMGGPRPPHAPDADGETEGCPS